MKCDLLVSQAFAFKCNLYGYAVAQEATIRASSALATVGLCTLNPADPPPPRLIG
jgi:hypothetical protein